MWVLVWALLASTAPGWCSWPAGPAFVDSPVNVTVNEGSHAFLPCRVSNLGDRSVTWMRRRQLHIITAGLLTYSPDDRYRVLHPTDTDEWTLHIRHAQPEDGGWYECQVNSDPKITTPVLLIVKDKRLEDPFFAHDLEGEENAAGSEVHIAGPHERYIQEGSILAVTCTVDHPGRRAVQAVVWYRGAARLDYDAPRGGIALQSSGESLARPPSVASDGTFSRQTEKTPSRTVSRLRLSAVTPEDSARYSCRPDTGGSASVSVHVQSDQPRAAVQHSGHSSASSATSYPCTQVLLLFALSHLAKHSTLR